jgi:WhiB family redox-sensing transcriptional regulator
MNRDWMVSAKCRGVDPDLFFPTSTGNGARTAVAAAAVICRGCPVVGECREYARELNVPFGVWGGEGRPGVHSGFGGNRVLAPHGTEAAAKRHYRNGEKPCGACLEARTLARVRRGQ